MAQETEVVNGSKIYSALMKITEEAKKDKKKRGLDFRFFDKRDNKTEENKETAFENIENLETALERYGISVEFYEDIDLKDVSDGCKYSFRIYDVNNCFIEIDALEYRKIVLDSSKSEEDYIAEKLFKILGLKVQADVLEISKTLTELISYVYYFAELQYKVYENIGWGIYDKELIFKYDRIYRKDGKEIRSVCINDIAGNLVNEYSELIKANWRDKFAELMNSSTEARIVISAACTGLVRSLMPYNKETNINMNIIGEPGSGKSSLCQFALSIFGNPHSLEGSFIDKDNAMEVIRVKRPVIPYILDDRLLKLDKSSDDAKGRGLLFDIFREYEGKVTERIGGTYKELSGRRTTAPIISSSVESMLNLLMKSGKDLGQYRRFIEIELKRSEIFGGDSRNVAEYHKLSYQNYGIGIQYIVDYILSVGVVFIDKLYKCIEEDITKKLNEKSDGLSASASRFALIATTYVIIREAINTVNFESEDGASFDGLEFVGSKGVISEETLEEQRKLILKSCQQEQPISDDEIIKLLLGKNDDCYTELVDYLINNLLQKMQSVNVRIKVEDIKVKENIELFLSKPSNMKWFVTKNKTDFFNNHASTHIGYKETSGNSTKIVFKGGKYIEWLFCSGKELTDDEIADYLKVVSEKQNVESYAEKLFGSDIVGKDIAVEIEKEKEDGKCLHYRKEDRSGRCQNVVSITVSSTESGEETV